jgi:excisionase family DNA binding protein
METLLVNDREASRLLGISRSKFHELVATGHIPRLKIGRSARYRGADLLAFTERLAAEAGVREDLASGAARI